MAEEEKKVSEEELVEKYQKHFDANLAYQLLKKLRKATRGKPKIISGSTGAIVEVLGKLISALDNPAMPGHYKALCIGAIGYIVLPVDLIPDAIPVLGFSDDLASAGGVAAAISIYSSFSMKKLDEEIDEEEKQAKLAQSISINKIEDNNHNSISDYKECGITPLENLENFIPEIQKIIAETKVLDFQTLKQLEDYLDELEDAKDSIPHEDINNIERCKKKLLASLNRCENKDDIQVDIDIILESFDNILQEV